MERSAGLSDCCSFCNAGCRVSLKCTCTICHIGNDEIFYAKADLHSAGQGGVCWSDLVSRTAAFG